MLILEIKDINDFTQLRADRSLHAYIGDINLPEANQNPLKTSIPLNIVQPYVQDDSLLVGFKVSSFNGLG